MDISRKASPRYDVVDNHTANICMASGKKMYSKRKQALTAKNINKAEKEIDLYIYQCTICKTFHLTSKGGSRNVQ